MSPHHPGNADDRLADAKGRLLAAEAEYLHATGWVPYVVVRGVPAMVVWNHPSSNVSQLTQDEALFLQKTWDRKGRVT